MQKESSNKGKFTTISAQEFKQLHTILRDTLVKMSQQGIIKHEDLNYLIQLIETESLKQTHNTGSAILTLALKLNNIKF
jgi:hypothetical protein